MHRWVPRNSLLVKRQNDINSLGTEVIPVPEIISLKMHENRYKQNISLGVIGIVKFL